MGRFWIYLLLLVGVLALLSPWRGFIRDDMSAGEVPVVEMAIFEAGYGMEWYQNVAKSFEAQRQADGKPVDVYVWGDPRVLDKVNPRILARRPPAMVEAYLPFWTLVLSDVLEPFNDLLAQPVPGRGGQTYRDMFYKGALEEYSYKGKVYALPVIYNAWVMWYDKRLFREHGWEVPETWEALLELGDKAREQGLVPVSFQGKFGVYSACYFYHLIQSIGGLELYDRCQAMDPGAFTHPDTVEAARKLQELSERCFAPASLAWSHEEAQDELCQGRAAMVACGLWFEKEMEGKIPPEMELSAFPLPPVAGGKGDPRAIYAGPGETIYKFRDGKNVELADPFLAELISVENMVAFANQNSSLVAIREANELADLTPAMETVRAFLAEKTIRYQEKLETYAQPWEMQYRRPLTEALLAGEITPEAFCQKLEAGMEIMRNDPDLVKPEFKSHTKH